MFQFVKTGVGRHNRNELFELFELFLDRSPGLTPIIMHYKPHLFRSITISPNGDS